MRKGRLYGPQWRSARVSYLELNPYCVPCERAGRTEPAVLIHHKIPHRNVDLKLFWDVDNWESRCLPCHGDATGPERTGRAETYKGASLDGTPLDPAHHWHRPAGGGVGDVSASKGGGGASSR